MNSHTRAITGAGQKGRFLVGEGAEVGIHTEILNVLIGEVAQRTRLLGAVLLTGTPCLVHHNPVCRRG